MTALKEMLTPTNIAVAVAAIAALAAVDYFAGTNVLGWIGEQLGGAKE